MSSDFSFNLCQQYDQHEGQYIDSTQNKNTIKKQNQSNKQAGINSRKGVLSKIILQNKLPILSKDYSSIKKFNFSKKQQPKNEATSQSKSSQFIFQSQVNSICENSQQVKSISFPQQVILEQCNENSALKNNKYDNNVQQIFTFQPSPSAFAQGIQSKNSTQFKPATSSKAQILYKYEQNDEQADYIDKDEGIVQSKNNKYYKTDEEDQEQKQQNRTIKIMQHLQNQYQRQYDRFIQQASYYNTSQTELQHSNALETQIMKRSLNKFEIFDFNARKYGQIIQNNAKNTRKNTKKLSTNNKNNTSFKSRQIQKQQKAIKNAQTNKRTQIKQFIQKCQFQKHNIFKLIPIKLWTVNNKQQIHLYQNLIANEFANQIVESSHRTHKLNQYTAQSMNKDNNVIIDAIRLEEIYIKQRELTQKFTAHEIAQFLPQQRTIQNECLPQQQLLQNLHKIFVTKFYTKIKPQIKKTSQQQSEQTYKNTQTKRNKILKLKMKKVKKYPQFLPTCRILKMMEIKMIQYGSAVEIQIQKRRKQFNLYCKNGNEQQLKLINDNQFVKNQIELILNNDKNKDKKNIIKQNRQQQYSSTIKQQFITQYNKYFTNQQQQQKINNNTNNNNNNFDIIYDKIKQQFINNYNQYVSKIISSKINGKMIYQVQNQITDVRKKQQLWMKVVYGIIKDRNRKIYGSNINSSTQIRNIYINKYRNNINNSINSIDHNMNNVRRDNGKFADLIYQNQHNFNTNSTFHNKNKKKLYQQQSQTLTKFQENNEKFYPSLQIMKKLKPTAQLSGSSTIINKPTNYSHININTNTNMNTNINSLSSSLANSSIINNSNNNSNSYDIYQQNRNINRKGVKGNAKRENLMAQKRVQLQQYIDNMCQNQNYININRYNRNIHNNNRNEYHDNMNSRQYNNNNHNINMNHIINTNNNTTLLNNTVNNNNTNNNNISNSRYIKYSKFPIKFTPNIHFNSQNPQDCTIVYNVQQIQIKQLTLKFIKDRRKFGVNFVKIMYKGNIQYNHNHNHNHNHTNEHKYRRRRSVNDEYEEKYQQQIINNQNINDNDNNYNDNDKINKKWKIIKIMQMLHCLGAKVIIQQDTGYQIMEDKYDATVQMLAFVLRANVQQIWQQYSAMDK